ncbi:MAG: hypothetical protein QM775_36080 [Pirellulales bacterium]
MIARRAGDVAEDAADAAAAIPNPANFRQATHPADSCRSRKAPTITRRKAAKGVAGGATADARKEIALRKADVRSKAAVLNRAALNRADDVRRAGAVSRAARANKAAAAGIVQAAAVAVRKATSMNRRAASMSAVNRR